MAFATHLTIDDIAFSPDSSLLAPSSQDFRVQLFDTQRGQMVATLQTGWVCDGNPGTSHAHPGLGSISALVALEGSTRHERVKNSKYDRNKCA